MSIIDPDYDRAVYSHISVSDPTQPPVTHYDDGGPFTVPAMRRLTWQEAYEREHEQRLRSDEYATICSDLDRCEHGRHEGDVCNGCGGPSKGNPLLPPSATNRVSFSNDAHPIVIEPRQIGYTISGKPIVVPDREGGAKNDAAAWTQQ